jgi:hypothetical protein
MGQSSESKEFLAKICSIPQLPVFARFVQVSDLVGHLAAWIISPTAVKVA